MSSDYHKFEEKLKQIFPSISRNNMGDDKGIRILIFGAEVLDYVISPDEILLPLKKVLPNDATIVTFPIVNTLTLIQRDGTFFDQFGLFLCSKEWSRVEAGGKIPDIRTEFRKHKDDPIVCFITESAVSDIKDHKSDDIHISFQEQIRYINYKLRLEYLLSVILDTTSSSKSVMTLTQEIKNELDMEGKDELLGTA